MRRRQDLKDSEVWLMVQLGYTNPPRLLVKRRLQKVDAEALRVKNKNICGASAMGHMIKE